MEGYELSEDAARRTAAAVRRVEAMTPDAGNDAASRRNVPYKPAFYRLATNAGAGAYTCRRQAWNNTTKAFADVAEEHQAEYGAEVTTYDFQERADGVAGAAGIGQIVRGWKIHVGGTTPTAGTWITLVDVGTGGVPGEAVARDYSYKAHIDGPYDLPGDPDEAVFFTIADVRNSTSTIMMEIRLCDGDGATGTHPAFTGGAVFHGGAPVIVMSCGETGDGAWHSLTISRIGIDGTATTQASNATVQFQVRMSAAGAMEFRMLPNPGDAALSCVLTIAVHVIYHTSGLDVDELGTGDCSTVDGVFGCPHEWGDPADPDPVIHPWGDGKWRHL